MASLTARPDDMKHISSVELCRTRDGVKIGVTEEVADSNDPGPGVLSLVTAFKSVLYDEATAFVEQLVPLWYDVPKECTSE